MSRIVYVNGRYRPYAEASVHVEDRGFQFADAVYEVIQVAGGRLVDERRHMERLERSLGQIAIAQPMTRAALAHVVRETVQRNRVQDGLVYVQVSRGAARRDFALPAAHVQASVVILARQQVQQRISAQAETGISVITMSDTRWARCDIKTVMLLPAVLAKHAARAAGASEVWFLDLGGNVTEGASSNAWIVNSAGVLVTRFLDATILPGVTRATAIATAKAEGVHFEERAFSLAEAYAAREAFITSATNTVMPVVRIDDHTIDQGRPGPITLRLRQLFHRVAEISCP